MKILQILDINSVEVDQNLFNITAVNRFKDPYWVEFIQQYFLQADVEIKILSLDKIDLSKKWLINVDINMWNWHSYKGNIFNTFNDLIKKELKYGNAFLILNHQCESYTTKFFELFYSKEIDIPYKKIIYMVAAADVETSYKNFIEKNHIPAEKQFNTIYAHHVYKRFHHGVDINSFQFSTVSKTKKFLSLNRMWRKHRVMLVSMLSHKNLLQHGYVSLGVFPEEKNQAYALLEHRHMQQGFLKIIDSLPLQIDNVDLKINQFQMNSLDIFYYQQSCFSLVSSTMALAEQELSVGFTEKEIKPILARHPFIIWNRPGVLKHLQSMGFLTFESWFDESYDDELDDILRLEKIIVEVERLCNMSFDQWELLLDEMKPVLNHNFNRMTNYTAEHCFFNSDLKKLLYYVS